MAFNKVILFNIALLCQLLSTCIKLASAELFSRRDLKDSRFNNVRTAILIVNSNPTTCEVGLVSPNIGIFASGCLVLDKEGYRDEDAQYGVYVYEGDGSDEPIEYYSDTSDIHLLAISEDVTWHANLAAIRYRKDSNDTYMPYVSINSYYIDDSSYSLRALDFETNKWREAEVEQQLDDPQDQCGEYNRLYKSNYFMFSCNNQTVESVYDSNCRMPYGALYTIKDEKVALVAIYTHSVILGYDECIDPRLNYYTYIWPFVQFASWIFEEPIYAYNENASETVVSVSDRPDIVIDAGSPNTIIGVSTVGADLYARYQSKETSSSDTDPESTHSSNFSDDMSLSGSKSTETDTGPDSDLDTDGSSSSNTAKVVAGAVVGLISSMVGIAAESCFVIDDTGEWNYTTEYGVYVYEGDGSSVPTQYYKINNGIYNAGLSVKTTYANLVVFKFRDSTDNTYTPLSIFKGYTIADSSYKSRLLDLDTEEWIGEQSVQQVADPYDLCIKYNRFYKAYHELYTCNNVTIESVYDSDCRMPYGALYTTKGDEVALVAIYTHSVILGDDECKDPRKNYYTYVSQYLEYASFIFNEPIKVVDSSKTITISATTLPTVTIDAGVSNESSGITTVGANLYARFGVKDNPSSSTNSEASAIPGLNIDFMEDDMKNNNIGMIVGFCCAAVVVAVIIFWWIRKTRRSRARRQGAVEPADMVIPVAAVPPRTSVPVSDTAVNVRDNNEENETSSQTSASVSDVAVNARDYNDEGENPPSYEYTEVQIAFEQHINNMAG
ncbi:hypothetical protein IWW45_001369 [Coemansia sp. RSA 485]|nr:hypothetical protein IWW45_001369 [Coemansia sp. RSA 485]